MQVLFLVAENTTAKSAECHAAPTAGLLWFLITLTTLLRNLHSKRRHTPGQMFSEHPWRVVVCTNMSPKSHVGPVISSVGVLIIIRTNSDLVRPSVHHPLFLPHAPYEFLMASHILGVWPANIFCKFFFWSPKTLLPKVPKAMLHRPPAFCVSLQLLLLCLGISTASIATRRGRCFPSTHGVLLSTQTCPQHGKLALGSLQ